MNTKSPLELSAHLTYFLTLSLGTSVSGLFCLAIASLLVWSSQPLMRGRAVGSQPLKVTYWAVRPTYSAQGEGGNCERGAGRCSAAQSEFDAPRKIFQPKSLIFRLKDFAGMEKVRFLALISYFSASFYCGKEAKTLVGTIPYSGILG